MVRLRECSSYRGFVLSSDFYEKVLVKVQREFKNSSSYWKFELSGGSSYRECTVIETECEIVISNDVTINWKVHVAEIMETILGIQ